MLLILLVHCELLLLHFKHLAAERQVPRFLLPGRGSLLFKIIRLPLLGLWELLHKRLKSLVVLVS